MIYRLIGTAVFAFGITVSLAGRAFSQAAPKLENPTPQQSFAQSHLIDFFGQKTPYEFWLTIAILISGLIFFGLSTRFVKSVESDKAEQAIRMVTTVLVVISTLVLITAGYNNEQIAPAFGLFGTLIGYLLGRAQRTTPDPGLPGPDTVGGSGDATIGAGAR